MRSLLLLLAIQLATIPSLTGQETDRADEAPPGTNFIADRSSRRFYPIACEAVDRVPRSDRLYYATESAVERDGYVESPDCWLMSAFTLVLRFRVEP